jgi:nitrate/TMAO reductase-like tetraheme cytochrome c subunit
VDYSVNNHHYARYIKLIEWAKFNPPFGMVEKHHIVPRSMGGSNKKENLVALSPRVHFIAHWMLWKAYKNGKMANAFWTMKLCNGMRLNSKSYEQARIIAIEYMASIKRGKKASEATKLKMSLASKGKPRPIEVVEKIRQSHIGKKRSNEAKANMSKAHVGKKLSDEIKAKMSAAKKGKPPNNMGKVYTMKEPMPLELRLKLGEQRRGRIMSKESSIKKSLATKGRPLSKSNRENIKRTWSDPEVRAKQSQRMKEVFAMKKNTPPVSPTSQALPWSA